MDESPDQPTEQSLKARLREIHRHQPDLAQVIGRRWPPGVPAIRDPWRGTHCQAVALLLDQVDVEGPMCDPSELERVSQLFDTLAFEGQGYRVTTWITEAASDPNRYRPLALGAGNHTTRRITLAETCLLIAGNDISDTTLREFIADTTGNDPVEIPAIGHALGQLNWREAQHLLTLTRLHLNLHTTIESEPT